ncbi:MAG TPA: hypothetical protein DCP63_12015 [Bacteroidetes bacterium]|nr:hypothetical protein [Bacteroidota bacterium]
MKTATLLLALCLAALPALSQEETLFNGNIESGGFGGPVLKAGGFNGEAGLLVGGRGGWIINNSFIVGGGGYGLVNSVKAKALGPRNQQYLDFGYGGLELEYISRSNKLIHLSFMTMIGAGGVGWRDREMGYDNDSNPDAFFILEPAVNATLNVTRYFRISAGASYRYISGVSSNATTNADLSGPSGTLTFRFGKF